MLELTSILSGRATTGSKWMCESSPSLVMYNPCSSISGDPGTAGFDGEPAGFAGDFGKENWKPFEVPGPPVADRALLDLGAILKLKPPRISTNKDTSKQSFNKTKMYRC